MNLKFVVGFLVYYLAVAMFFNFGGLYLNGAATTVSLVGFTANTSLDATNSSAAGYVPGSSDFFTMLSGALSRIVSTAGFMFFGIGLPADTPAWFAWIFSGMMTCITLLAAAVLIDSIWHGG